jgi:transposase
MKKIEEDAKEILELLRKEKDLEVKLRLCALNLIAVFKMPVRDVSEAISVPLRAIYDWIRYWQKEGYAGLKDKPILGGRPPRLGKEDIEKLKGYLKERPFWTTKEVRHQILERFNIELSENQSKKDLERKTKDENFSKPYP